MQKEQHHLQIDLKLAKTQIKFLHNQNLAKNSELQCAKAKLNQYNPKYRRPDSKIVQKYEQCKYAQEKWREAIN